MTTTSTKHPELAKLEHVNVDDLMTQGPVDKDGYLSKEGGHFKSWKRRWCVLRGATMYYFAAPHSCTCKGAVVLDPHAEAVPGTPFHKSDSKHNYFSLKTRQRMLYMCAISQAEMDSWISTINLIAKSLLQQVHDRSLVNTSGDLPTPLTLSSSTTPDISNSHSSNSTSCGNSTGSSSSNSTGRSYSVSVNAANANGSNGARSNSFGADGPVAVIPSLVAMPLPLHVPQSSTAKSKKKATANEGDDLDL
ncbi:hypothetical protein Pelo_7903 [Pelomyxa schiedti]|nr:hypothetical protein Pelo_7903 [Pelomyxa schiedti]